MEIPIDVYDAFAWRAIFALSAQSAAARSRAGRSPRFHTWLPKNAQAVQITGAARRSDSTRPGAIELTVVIKDPRKLSMDEQNGFQRHTCSWPMWQTIVGLLAGPRSPHVIKELAFISPKVAQSLTADEMAVRQSESCTEGVAACERPKPYSTMATRKQSTEMMRSWASATGTRR